MQITGKLLTQNWILNLGGQILPIAIGLATMPYIVRGLGPERFGVLSIAWALLGYFGLLDMGLGRATTKFVAECLGQGDTRRLPALVWTSLLIQVSFGLAGSILAAAGTPILVDRVLKLSPWIRGETRVCLFILAASLPLVLAGNALRGVLEAAQRFDWVNYVRVPANASFFLLPALALPMHLGLPGIVLLLVTARAISAVAYLALSVKLFPALRRAVSVDFPMLRPLLVFGSWITVSNTVGPFLTYVDRFFIGSIVSMTAVGYYTAPYEAITRASVIPGSLTATLFPAFSWLQAGGSGERVAQLCARSLKSLLIVLGPALLIAIVFAQEFLRVWLGAEYASKGALVLQILAIGVLANALAFVPLSLLQGLSRPDLTAKFHLLELPLYIATLYLLLQRMGIAGAALAWTLRVSFDALLHFGAVIHLHWITYRTLIDSGFLRTFIAICVFGGLLAISRAAGEPMWLGRTVDGAAFLVFGFAAWKYLLDSRDRNLMISAAVQFRTILARLR